MTNAPNNDDHVGNEDQLQAVHARLQELERKPRLVSSPEELESLERDSQRDRGVGQFADGKAFAK